MKEPAIDLLRGDAPTRGRRLFFEKWGFYQKLNLYSRTMVKNVLSDKGRMATTMVGVMGCTALLVACFSMKLGIQNALQAHFDQCASYDYRLVVDSKTGNPEDFVQVLDSQGSLWPRPPWRCRSTGGRRGFRADSVRLVPAPVGACIRTARVLHCPRWRIRCRCRTCAP